jgi:hypothetical protein
MPEKELRTLALERVPPGDRWREPDGKEVYPTLTDGMNAVFERTGVTNFFISARDGNVYMVTTEEVAPPPPPKPKKFSIYGDE